MKLKLQQIKLNCTALTQSLRRTILQPPVLALKIVQAQAQAHCTHFSSLSSPSLSLPVLVMVKLSLHTPGNSTFPFPFSLSLLASLPPRTHCLQLSLNITPTTETTMHSQRTSTIFFPLSCLISAHHITLPLLAILFAKSLS